MLLDYEIYKKEEIGYSDEEIQLPNSKHQLSNNDQNPNDLNLKKD